MARIEDALKGRESAEKAEYMELIGAKKDGDCREVEVKGGVSKELGCCDYFKPRNAFVKQFKCGTCHYLIRGDK